MSTEQRVYRGNLIQSLINDVAKCMSRDPLRHYILQDSAGSTFGIACEMLESEAEARNRKLHNIVDYRWTIIPEKGSR